MHHLTRVVLCGSSSVEHIGSSWVFEFPGWLSSVLKEVWDFVLLLVLV